MEDIRCSKNIQLGSLIIPIVRKPDFCFSNGHPLNYKIIDSYSNQFLNNQYKTTDFVAFNSFPRQIKNNRIKKLAKCPNINFNNPLSIFKRRTLKKLNMEFLPSRKIVFKESNVRFVFEIAANLDK